MTPEQQKQFEQEAEEFKQRPHYKDGSCLSVSPQIYLKRGYIAGRTVSAEKTEQLEAEVARLKRLISLAWHQGEDNMVLQIGAQEFYTDETPTYLSWEEFKTKNNIQ